MCSASQCMDGVARFMPGNPLSVIHTQQTSEPSWPINSVQVTKSKHQVINLSRCRNRLEEIGRQAGDNPDWHSICRISEWANWKEVHQMTLQIILSILFQLVISLICALTAYRYQDKGDRRQYEIWQRTFPVFHSIRFARILRKKILTQPILGILCKTLPSK